MVKRADLGNFSFESNNHFCVSPFAEGGHYNVGETTEHGSKLIIDFSVWTKTTPVCMLHMQGLKSKQILIKFSTEIDKSLTKNLGYLLLRENLEGQTSPRQKLFLYVKYLNHPVYPFFRRACGHGA